MKEKLGITLNKEIMNKLITFLIITILFTSCFPVFSEEQINYWDSVNNVKRLESKEEQSYFKGKIVKEMLIAGTSAYIEFTDGSHLILSSYKYPIRLQLEKVGDTLVRVTKVDSTMVGELELKKWADSNMIKSK